MGEDLLAFATEDAGDEGVAAEEVFVVAEEFGTAKEDGGIGQEGAYATEDVHELFVIEEPTGGKHNVGALTIDLGGNGAGVLVDGGRNDLPMEMVGMEELGVEGRKSQG